MIYMLSSRKKCIITVTVQLIPVHVFKLNTGKADRNTLIIKNHFIPFPAELGRRQV
jgi:hypothetical protein